MKWNMTKFKVGDRVNVKWKTIDSSPGTIRMSVNRDGYEYYDVKLDAGRYVQSLPLSLLEYNPASNDESKVG